ncbi:MAG: CoA-binding protein [Acidimicrobiia bacterium]|nr:CoA-binding protein [Acidimicrobiia bacterium]
MDTISTLLNEGDPVVAVVGATDNPQKFGNRIYRDLKGKGFRVYPVNPSRDTVDGDLSYARLSDLPEKPDIINFVVPPTRTLRVLEQAKELGFTTVWIQPGAENETVKAYLEEHGFEYLVNACIMVRARFRSTI